MDDIDPYLYGLIRELIVAYEDEDAGNILSRDLISAIEGLASYLEE